MLAGIVNVGAAMPPIDASEFKARCLTTMDSVVSKGEVRVVTKNALPMLALHPYARERSGPPFGLRPKLEICGDIIEPLADIACEALA
ncbi:MAG: type II toxin-antitoxin system Phd/YefM family antitoxin [Candidatus Accumulibacter sp.]|uniref:type II toxin-antitoxin system Phd/YefM family antitoxin n=1 Tax=Accumulibacter sp. TaxID=2053492 RepID=UPI002586AE47|nr:type II toxin-antitoxin system Phd/YefM family antitoxin [Accumulibacter sp.]MCM8621030.1 type II toxin-antitoxin system Phd/YefM family antitoxin [Accumulibacter sp.]